MGGCGQRAGLTLSLVAGTGILGSRSVKHFVTLTVPTEVRRMRMRRGSGADQWDWKGRGDQSL